MAAKARRGIAFAEELEIANAAHIGYVEIGFLGVAEMFIRGHGFYSILI